MDVDDAGPELRGMIEASGYPSQLKIDKRFL
jgi:hypothetical protein